MHKLSTYRISSPITQSRQKAETLKVRVFPLDSSCPPPPPQKSKTISYKPRAKLLIVTGRLSKQTSQMWSIGTQNLQTSDLHTGVQPPGLTRKQLHKPCYSRKLLKLPFWEKVQTRPPNHLPDPIAQTSLTHPLNLVLLFLFLILLC